MRAPAAIRIPPRHNREKQTDNSTQHKAPTESQDCNAFERTLQHGSIALGGTRWRTGVRLQMVGGFLSLDLRILAQRIPLPFRHPLTVLNLSGGTATVLVGRRRSFCFSLAQGMSDSPTARSRTTSLRLSHQRAPNPFEVVGTFAGPSRSRRTCRPFAPCLPNGLQSL
jgi:hypothetical protein